MNNILPTNGTIMSDNLLSITNTSTVAYAEQQEPQPSVLTTASNQEWIDKQSNTKVSFTYSPDIPVAGKFTELKFNIEDLNNGTYVKDVFARVTLVDVQQQQPLQVPLRSYSVTAPNGYFSIKYQFPHEGTYQIIVKVNSKYSALALASFKIYVPFRPLAVIDVKQIRPLLIPVGLVGIIGTAAIIAFMVVVKKTKK